MKISGSFCVVLALAVASSCLPVEGRVGASDNTRTLTLDEEDIDDDFPRDPEAGEDIFDPAYLSEADAFDRDEVPSFLTNQNEGADGPHSRTLASSGSQELISNDHKPIVYHDKSWGKTIYFSHKRCGTSNYYSYDLEPGRNMWWTTGYPYTIRFENGKGVWKKYLLRPGTKYYFTKKSDGSLELYYYSGQLSSKADCRSYIPTEPPIVKYVTYDSVTCHNARNSMRQDARDKVLNDLLLMSSDWVKTESKKVCSGTDSLSGNYNYATQTVTGSVSTSKTCESEWKQEFGRTPENWKIVIGDPATGKCDESGYKCITETDFWGARDSWGQLTVSCPYRLVFLG